MTWPWRTTQKYGFNDMGVPGEVPSNELDSKHSVHDIAPVHRTCFFRGPSWSLHSGSVVHCIVN